MKSISRQLAITTTALIGVVLFVAGVGLYFGMRAALHAQFDEALYAKAMSVRSQLSWDRKGIEFEADWSVMPGFIGGDEAEYFLILVEGHGEVARSPSLLAGRTLPTPDANDQAFVTWEAPLPDGRRGRGMSVAFMLEWDDEDDATEVDDVPPEQFVPDLVAPVTLTVAADRAPLTRSLASMIVGLAIVGAALLLLIPITVTMAVRHGLRPVRRMNDQVEAIDEHHLDARLDTVGMPIELRASVDRMNGLLGRLSEAFAREKRFAAGAAHELRTPLAEMRTVAEVALRTDVQGEEAHGALREVVDAAHEMEVLVEGLLQIARGEARSRGRELEAVDVGALVRESKARTNAEASERGLDVRVDIDTDRRALGERALIAAIIDNLTANAVRYAPSGTTIDIRLIAADGRLLVRFSNEAPGMTPDDLPRLFEPLWRGDPARTSRGAGLGLAVARTLARQLGGDITAELDRSSRAFTIGVALPVADADEDRP